MLPAKRLFHPRNNIAVILTEKNCAGKWARRHKRRNIKHARAFQMASKLWQRRSNMAEDAHDNRLGNHFQVFATKVAYWVGTKWAFFVSLLIIVGWAVVGPTFHYSNTWQLVINTATTIVTFLMVFLIQNTQNRDARAIHLKLDEIIHSIRHASDDMISIEHLSDKELESLAKNYDRIRAEYEMRKRIRKW
jgi:low affinity Fe/Cu permease